MPFPRNVHGELVYARIRCSAVTLGNIGSEVAGNRRTDNYSAKRHRISRALRGDVSDPCQNHHLHRRLDETRREQRDNGTSSPYQFRVIDHDNHRYRASTPTKLPVRSMRNGEMRLIKPSRRVRLKIEHRGTRSSVITKNTCDKVGRATNFHREFQISNSIVSTFQIPNGRLSKVTFFQTYTFRKFQRPSNHRGSPENL